MAKTTRKRYTGPNGQTIEENFADECATRHRDLLAYSAGRWWIADSGAWREARGHADSRLIRDKITAFASGWVPAESVEGTQWQEYAKDFAYRVRRDVNGYYAARRAMETAWLDYDAIGMGIDPTQPPPSYEF